MPPKDAKYDQHYQMIAESSRSDERYVIKFYDNPVEYTGKPVLNADPDEKTPGRFNFDIHHPADFRGSGRQFNVRDIEYMRKIAEDANV